MRIASFEHFDLRPWRFILVSAVAAACAGTLVWTITGEALGAVAGPAATVVTLVSFYAIASIPRRLLDRQRVAQARDSVVVSAAAMACLGVTGSRSRTVIFLRSGEPTVSVALREAGRKILLGETAAQALEGAASKLSSYSAAAALRNLASMGTGRFDPGDEESRGLENSAELSRETKIPVFMTVCFFAPILLVLYSVFSHSYSLLSLAELAAAEFVLLDLAFYLTSGEKWLG